MSHFIHPAALCESTSIGNGTRIWAFAHVLAGASIGADCNVCDHVFIEDEVSIGDRVTIKCGVQLWNGLVVEDDVFIGPNATFCNDRFPRSKQHLDAFPKTVLRHHASIGANATILPGLVIGAHAMIGAGAVVTRSVPANAIVVGNPARIVGYVNADSVSSAGEQVALSAQVDVQTLDVKGVAVHRLAGVRDMRGSLTAMEFERHVPFEVKRAFMVYDVPNREIRGEHAHWRCHQFLICVRGSCAAVVDDGVNRREVLLDSPDFGLHMPPMIWGTQYKYSADALLLVLASHAYDAADYIREYDEFRQALLQKDSATGSDLSR